MGLGSWMTSCPEARAEDFGIWEKAVSWVPATERSVETQTWARPDNFVRYGRRMLVGLRAEDVKALSTERLCLSLLMSKNL